jgi:hypothetical protein
MFTRALLNQDKITSMIFQNSKFKLSTNLSASWCMHKYSFSFSMNNECCDLEIINQNIKESKITKITIDKRILYMQLKLQ